MTQPYHCYVPSFGEWGFVIGVKDKLPDVYHFPEGLRFISQQSVRQLFNFPPDMARLKSPYNTLNNQVLVNTFEKEWADYTR